MKPEIKKKREQLKKEFAVIKKQASKNGKKKMLTVEMNKTILDTMTKKNEEEFGEVVEKVKKSSHRSFTCSCGCKVTLEGTAEPNIKGKCSKCAEEILEKE